MEIDVSKTFNSLFLIIFSFVVINASFYFSGLTAIMGRVAGGLVVTVIVYDTIFKDVLGNRLHKEFRRISSTILNLWNKIVKK